MTHWIHFVGKSYYSQKSFVAEAAEHGITRRVSRRTAKQMDYGDTVWLAINDGKSAVMFGKFVISTISGLSGAEMDRIAESIGIVQVSAGGKIVGRGCGSYIEGPTFMLEKPIGIPKLLELIDGVEPQGKLMVGGELIEVENVRLKNLRFSQGFRPFDPIAYQAAVIAAKNGSRKKTVKGHFYSHTGNESNVVYLDARRAQVVGDYRKKP